MRGCEGGRSKGQTRGDENEENAVHQLNLADGRGRSVPIPARALLNAFNLNSLFTTDAKASCHGFTKVLLRLCNTGNNENRSLVLHITIAKCTDDRWQLSNIPTTVQ
jgi:hypothetical protein